MKISANIATHAARSGTLPKVIASLINQVDDIRIYNNEYLPNIADNGKFHFLKSITEPEYYFCCDDDIIYPPDYVEKTIRRIEMFGCIVTYHGRILKGAGLNYYHGHKSFHFGNGQHQNQEIDVAGTGVCAFDTKYFNPKTISNSPHLRMSDLLFSLEAAKQNKVIGLFEHEAGWLQSIPTKDSIYETERNNPTLVKLADEIYTTKYGSPDTTDRT